jgi:hypothetical protein
MPDFMNRRQVAALLGVSDQRFPASEVARLGIPHVTLRRQRDTIRVSKAAFRDWQRGKA